MDCSPHGPQPNQTGHMFFKAFHLSEGEVPLVNYSTMVACLQQVSIKSTKGGQLNWPRGCRPSFLQSLVGKSRVTAEQMTDCILINATTHFESRSRILCSLLGVNRKRASRPPVL